MSAPTSLRALGTSVKIGAVLSGDRERPRYYYCPGLIIINTLRLQRYTLI